MNDFASRRGIAFAAILVFSVAPTQAQLVRSGTGANAAAITPVRDQFRLDLGGGTTPGGGGSFGGVRREINWDGVPAASSAPNNISGNFFQARGVIYSTPGSGFQVSSATTDAGPGQPAPADFGNIDPSYTSTFEPFSVQRLFTSLGSNVMDVTFFLAGTSTPALTRGFGAIFSDVDLPNTTSIQFFDAANMSLGTFFVPNVAGAQQTFAFLGVSYATAVVSRVRITMGNAALGAGVSESVPPPGVEGTIMTDVVVMDDWIYGEPIPEPGTIALLTVGGLVVALRLRRRRS